MSLLEKLQFTVETAGTDITLNQYANGYLYVNDAAGEGQMLRIKSNPAHDHSADPSIVITCYDDLATAITTSSRITLIPDAKKCFNWSSRYNYRCNNGCNNS